MDLLKTLFSFGKSASKQGAVYAQQQQDEQKQGEAAKKARSNQQPNGASVPGLSLRGSNALSNPQTNDPSKLLSSMIESLVNPPTTPGIDPYQDLLLSILSERSPATQLIRGNIFNSDPLLQAMTGA